MFSFSSQASSSPEECLLRRRCYEMPLCCTMACDYLLCYASTILIHSYMCIYIYIYTERERDVCMFVVYIYIYILFANKAPTIIRSKHMCTSYVRPAKHAK